MRRAAGFTLVEILMVVGLVAVLAAVTVPLVAGAMDRYYILSAGQQVASTIRAARFQAVARNQTLDVVFDLAAGEYQVFEDGGVTAVGTAQQLPRGIGFGGESATTVEIAPNGRVTTAATIRVTNGNVDDDRTITVSTSGRVQLQ
jgi:prepilin-type N-terminal cleavage/methylation domain-containing protein